MPFLDHHITRLVRDPTQRPTGANLIATLFWGDEVETIERRGDHTRVVLFDGQDGWVRTSVRTRRAPPLAVTILDVSQGDACHVSTPCGHQLLIDGGENQMAARYLAKRHWASSKGIDLVVYDAVVVTHGDADHFKGLATLILDAADETRPGKRIKFATKRLFHNGLVKRPAHAGRTPIPDRDRLGPAHKGDDGRSYIEVVNDPRQVPRDHRNRHFRKWCDAIDELERRHAIEVRRLDSHAADAFDFLSDVDIDVLSPIPADTKPRLPLLRNQSGQLSSAATINGHSLVLRLRHGNTTILLTGDLTGDAQQRLAGKHDEGVLDLSAQVLKVPHHGSDDFAMDFLERVQPLVSIVSAGDEDATRDYMHPRATLLGALGKAGRGRAPLILVTNLSAFDRWAGRAFRASQSASGDWEPDVEGGVFYARERTVFGSIHVRTDGQQLMVARHSARKDRREAYCFDLSGPSPSATALDCV